MFFSVRCRVIGVTGEEGETLANLVIDVAFKDVRWVGLSDVVGARGAAGEVPGAGADEAAVDFGGGYR